MVLYGKGRSLGMAWQYLAEGVTLWKSAAAFPEIQTIVKRDILKLL